MLPRAGNFILDPNVHIKYPTITEGLKAAEISVKEGMRINMTLVFSQEQAAAFMRDSRPKRGKFLSRRLWDVWMILAKGEWI